jgi:hypothetical protein
MNPKKLFLKKGSVPEDVAKFEVTGPNVRTAT